MIKPETQGEIKPLVRMFLLETRPKMNKTELEEAVQLMSKQMMEELETSYQELIAKGMDKIQAEMVSWDLVKGNYLKAE